MRRSWIPMVCSLVLAAGCGGGSADDAGAGASQESSDAAADPVADPATDAGSTDTGSTDTGSTDSGTIGNGSGDDPMAAAPLLEPVSSFPLDSFVRVNQVAVSPDGSKVVAALQDSLGDPVTLQFYDVATGLPTDTIEFETIGIGQVHWMADNRLVVLATGSEGEWRTWDGATLEPLASFPVDDTCADGVVDKSTGAIYSSDGLSQMGDDLCRFDSTDGSMTRTAAGAFARADEFWVRPGGNEVLVVHSPDEEVARELLVLDGTTFATTSSRVLPFNEAVLAVAETLWIVDYDASTNVLQPGALPLPDIRDPLRSTDYGTMFYSSNGSDDLLFISATDGSVIGTMPAGMNTTTFADWSIDDSTHVRTTIDGLVEVFAF